MIIVNSLFFNLLTLFISDLEWAQRKDKIFTTFRVTDAKDVSITQTEEKLNFKCKDGSDQEWAFEFEFYSPVQDNKAQWKTTGRGVEVQILKKEDDQEYWPRLIKGNGKYRNVTVDWSKWIDQDEEDEDNFDWGSGNSLPSANDYNPQQQELLLKQLQEQMKNSGVSMNNESLDDLDEDDEEMDD